MAEVVAQFDKESLSRLSKTLGLVDARTIATRALNDVAKTARSRITKEIAGHFTLKQRDIRKGIRIIRANKSNMTARIELNGRRRSLRSFLGKPNTPVSELKRTKSGKLRKRKPYQYQIKVGGSRTVAKNVFVQRLKKAGAEFKTVGDGSVLRRFKALPLTRLGKARYPITVPRGPSVPGIWQADRQNRVAKDVIGDLRPQLAKRVRGQTVRLLASRVKKGKLGARDARQLNLQARGDIPNPQPQAAP